MKEQERALAAILDSVTAAELRPFLLHGITDSGKTEIYFRVMEKILMAGRQALYLGRQRT